MLPPSPSAFRRYGRLAPQPGSRKLVGMLGVILIRWGWRGHAGGLHGQDACPVLQACGGMGASGGCCASSSHAVSCALACLAPDPTPGILLQGVGPLDLARGAHAGAHQMRNPPSVAVPRHLALAVPWTCAVPPKAALAHHPARL